MKHTFIAIILALSFLFPLPNSVPSEKNGLYMSVAGDEVGNVEAKAEKVKHKFARVVFATDVNEDSVNQAIDFFEKNKDEVEFGVLELNTPGGSVPDGQRLAKYIEDFGKPMYCIVDGEAYSMGFYLLQTCDTRIMTRRSSLMAHEPALGGRLYGNQHYYRDLANVLEALSNAMAEHEAAKLCITPEAFKKGIENKAWWMDWKEAMRIGAVDYVASSLKAVLESLGQTGVLPAKGLLGPDSSDYCPPVP